MVLTTHAVFGGFLGGLAQVNPVFSFVLGFLSHFALDAIPHWDYPLGSSTKNKTEDPLKGDFIIGKEFLFDLIKIGTDFLLGIIVVFLYIYKGDILHPQSFLVSNIFWGALGGMVPDFLQFVYYKLKREPLTTLQRFHLFMHTNVRLADWHIVGPLLQIVLIVSVIWVYPFFF